MIFIFRIIYSLLLPFFCGWLILSFIFKDKGLSLSLHLGLSLGLGIGILSQWMLLLGILGVTYSSLAISSLLLVIIFWLQWQLKIHSLRYPQSSRRGKIEFLSQRWERICMGAVLFYLGWNVFVVFINGFNIPVCTWDAYATIAFKAKIIYYERSIADLPRFPHSAYPLLTPFTQAWIAFNLGAWDHQWIKAFCPFAYISFLSLFYGFLKKQTSFWGGILGVLLVISSKQFHFHGYIAYRDFWTMYYNCAAVMCLLLWFKQKDRRYLFVAGGLGGFLTFSKAEGQLYLGIMLFILLLMLAFDKVLKLKDRIKLYACFAGPSVGIWLVYFLYKISLGITYEEKARLEFGWQALTRLLVTFKKIFLDLFIMDNWGWVWILLGLSLLRLWRKAWPREITYLFWFIGFHFFSILVLSSFTASFDWLGGHLWTMGLPRLHLHFFPLAVAVIVLLNRGFFPADGPDR